ncbi:hypothetical protein [Yimella lutea]|uniref:hypothetical protein n=1 Tax=Yimella lutea TaxID=587872 RepID=UPI00114D5830|nr:hypothetical protein [Yimella lutea]
MTDHTRFGIAQRLVALVTIVLAAGLITAGATTRTVVEQASERWSSRRRNGGRAGVGTVVEQAPERWSSRRQNGGRVGAER